MNLVTIEIEETNNSNLEERVNLINDLDDLYTLVENSLVLNEEDETLNCVFKFSDNDEMQYFIDKLEDYIPAHFTYSIATNIFPSRFFRNAELNLTENKIKFNKPTIH